MPDFERVLQQTAEEILARYKGQPFLVAIDGKSCAGKTTFADRLGLKLKELGFAGAILRPSIDGFHNPQKVRYQLGRYSAEGYYRHTYDFEKIITGLLLPLRGEVFPVHCQSVAFDYRQDVPDEHFIEAEQNTILLFEGLFVMRDELNRYWDYRILLDISDDLSLERACVRDLADLGSVEEIRKKYQQRYMPAWKMYEKEVAPAGLADRVVKMDDFTK